MGIEMQECSDRVRIYDSDCATKGGGSGMGRYVARDLPLVTRPLRH